MTAIDQSAGSNIDVSELPSIAFGARSLAWWATLLLMLIEGTAFILIVAAYLYFRDQTGVWPPEPPMNPRPATAVTLALVASVVPMLLAHAAALRMRLRAMRLWLAVSTAMAIAALVARGFEFAALPYRWDASAYASVIWTTLGLHTFEVLTGTLENVVLTLILFRREVEQKRAVDVETTALFWMFAVGIWVPIYAVFYVEGLSP
jgi:heme/copper-type cytochrome/quinol oxidase subunit 3